MMTPFIAMILWGILSLFVTVLMFTHRKTDSRNEKAAYLILFFVTTLITGLLFCEYNQPHHGVKPTMKDVEEGTAHIDTLYQDDGTFYKERLVWDE